MIPKRILIAGLGIAALGLAALGWWCPGCQPWLKWTAMTLFAIVGLAALGFAAFGSRKLINGFIDETKKM
jgi:hypothetical protein